MCKILATRVTLHKVAVKPASSNSNLHSDDPRTAPMLQQQPSTDVANATLLPGMLGLNLSPFVAAQCPTNIAMASFDARVVEKCAHRAP
jgi:hypothetical protein